MVNLLESKFQSELKKEIKQRLPGCIVIKQDASQIQGIPDLLILHKDRWAALEVKAHEKAHRQPNQEYYVDKLDGMSYAAFIHPGNKEDVLDALCRSFGS